MIINLRDLADKLNALCVEQRKVMTDTLKELNAMGCGTATYVTATGDSHYCVGYQKIKGKFVFAIRENGREWIPMDEGTREHRFIIFGSLPALLVAIEKKMEDLLNRHTDPVKEVINALRVPD